jgi:hypothetical protein
MLRLLGLTGSALLGLVCLFVLFVVVLLAPIGSGMAQASSLFGFGGGVGLPFSSAGSSTANGTQIAASAQLLEEHVYGPWSNEYDVTNDVLMQSVSQFWIESCGANGVICPEAISGNLQCVEFVTGAMYLSGIRLPYVGDALTFWDGYADQAGWERLATSQSYPQLGDMVVWQGGAYGHIAIVIHVALPTESQDGSVTVAQGNGMGNRWDASQSSNPGNWYTMPLSRDGSVQTWTGYTVLGYIRQHT